MVIVPSGNLANAAFVGASSGEDLATMSKNAGVGQYSFINRKRYYQTYTAETSIVIGYSEMCFNIAEAMNRGWISSANAETWYQNGIKASLAFYGVKDGVNTVTFQKPGGGLFESVNYDVNFLYDTYRTPTVSDWMQLVDLAFVFQAFKIQYFYIPPSQLK